MQTDGTTLRRAAKLLFVALSVLFVAATCLHGQAVVEGMIESTAGGFKFPDGTVQTTAASGADPACPDDSGDIYVDCGNGTVTDNRTGLIWLQNANCLLQDPNEPSLDGRARWHRVVEFVAGLGDMPERSVAAASDCGLSDRSLPGDWRLATAAEWEEMISIAVSLGCVYGEFGPPAITNDVGTDCWQEGPGNSFTGVVSAGYWSSTNTVDNRAYFSSVHAGVIVEGSKALNAYMWPVRDH